MARLTNFHGLRLYGLDCTLHSPQPLTLRGYYGGVLRGVLGHALFRGNCVYPEPRCAECALRSGCPYPQVFKPHLLPGQDDRLPPYLLHRWQDLPQGLRFSLVLLNPALGFAENWLRQMDQFLPELDFGGQHGVRLQEVRDLASDQPVFREGRFIRGGRLNPLQPALPNSEQLTVHWLTPLVSKHQHSDPLLSALRTRLQRLVNAYGDGQPLAPPGTVPWRLVTARLRQQAMTQGLDSRRRISGLSGELELAELTPLGAQWLAAGSFLHAGGEATLGFGRYRWQLAD
ncbi:MAG: hypothetical protein QG599_188 [Pseudomonadota bacterium]|nr:hypothetical protein [Pseudomonadota bacterium]